MCQTAQPVAAAAPAVSPSVPTAAPAAATSTPRSTSSASSAHSSPAAQPSTHTPHSEDDDDEEDDDGWDEGEDDGDESFQKPDSSSFALSDDKATALHGQFSEVCQLLKHDEMDEGKKRKRKATGSQQADERRVKELLTAVYTAQVLPSAASSAAQPKRGRKKKVQCEVCYEEAQIITELTTEHKSDGDDTYALTLPGCQHNQVCTACLAGHIQSKVTSADVAAWVSCPHPTCTTPLHPNVLSHPGLLTTDVQLRLLLGYLTKLLSRSTAFVRCSTSHCSYGFLCLKKTGKESKVCPLCQVEQKVERGGEGELDADFKKMIASGTLRACPTCSHYTLKEKVSHSYTPCLPPLTSPLTHVSTHSPCYLLAWYVVQGICNVIECAKCGVWWNWRTRETGKSGTDLKQRARAQGTLWEQGELHYQMDLERRNPEEFRKLLERNGMVSKHQSIRSHSVSTQRAPRAH